MLAALVTDLLDVSRLQAGALAVAVQPVDPADAILPALEELGAGPASVDIDLDADAVVRADPVLLQRVIVNLLANAVRFSPEGQKVRIATSRFGSTAEIRIIDHGPGIPAERRDDVFVPFQRLGDTDNSTGLGLGLALSKGFVEGMDGTLTPEDTPGGGLTMVVSLPLVRDEEGV
jgi:two-component system sensor histidine kinase KdpD